MDSRARVSLQGAKTYQPGTSIEQAKRSGSKNVSYVKLASNENAFGASPMALIALRKAIKNLQQYPDPACYDLRKTLAKKWKLPPEFFAFGNGSDELLVLAIRAFVEPGEEVIVAQPTFLIYELQARVSGATVKVVPMSGLRYDLPAMQSAVTERTKLVFIANPDNPTGTYVTHEEVESFLISLPSNVIVVMDEAYFEFAYPKDYPKSLTFIGKYPVLITRTFSKAYGLAGLRVGYGMADPEIIMALNAVREPFNVNTLAQAAAIGALKDKAFLSKSKKLVKQGGKYLISEIEKAGFRPVPSVTNFILFEVGEKAHEVAQGLMQQGIIIREMTAWKLPEYLRVSVGTMPQNRKFVKALRVVSKDLGLIR